MATRFLHYARPKLVFTPVENTVDKQKAAANKDQAKRAPVLTWRMSYANERLSRDSVWH